MVENESGNSGVTQGQQQASPSAAPSQAPSAAPKPTGPQNVIFKGNSDGPKPTASDSGSKGSDS